MILVVKMQCLHPGVRKNKVAIIFGILYFMIWILNWVLIILAFLLLIMILMLLKKVCFLLMIVYFGITFMLVLKMPLLRNMNS
nr:MAG TPA: hypothetical protein [Caudoviricetes sp.]